MKEVEVTATVSPTPGDWAALSKISRGTIEAIYQHPLAHNLEWSGVVALFQKVGTVDQKGHNEIAFGIGGEHHWVRKPHNKDVSATEVMALRHMLTRAGWAPARSAHTAPAETVETAGVEPVDLLVVLDHHEARLYCLDVRSTDHVDHVIQPFNPHHMLSRNDQAHEQRQRAPEDHAFYENIAEAVLLARAVVVIGHGTGRSNAAHHLIEFLHQHHPDTARKVVCEVIADLSSLTAPQLLDLGRRALTADSETPASPTKRLI